MNITEIIKAVQRADGIADDGVAGNDTWSHIAARYGLKISAETHSSPLGDELAGIAETQIGTQEDSAHTNRGDAILKYQRATNLAGQGWPWCAAFVDWCVQQLFARHPEFGRRFPDFHRPQTAAAFGLIDWARESGCQVFTPDLDDPQRGDIVVYTFSHCGIVADVDRRSPTFHAIEGNTNEQGGRDGCTVARKGRNFSSVNRFIRLPSLGEHKA